MSGDILAPTQSSSPGTPASGKSRLWSRTSDKRWYSTDDAGVEYAVSSDNLPGAVRLQTAPLAGATSLALNVPLATLGANLGWLIIDPFTVECEVRKLSGLSGKTATVAALTYDHAVNDAVLWRDTAVFQASWFGVAGNGTTIDSVPMQAALTEIGASGGGVLALASGQTYLCADLTIGDTTHIVGNGATLRLPTTADAHILRNAGYDASTPNTTVALINVVLDGDRLNRSTASTSNLAVWRGISRLGLFNCTFQNNSSGLTGCAFSTTANDDIEFQSCRFLNNIGLTPGNPADVWNALGDSVTSDHLYCKGSNFRIHGSMFENCDDFAIALESVIGATVTGNTIRGDTSGYGIMGNGIGTSLNSRDIIVANNVIEGVRYYGLYADVQGGAFLDNVQFVNNIVRSVQATTTLRAAITEASTSMTVEAAAGLVVISGGHTYVVDNTGVPREITVTGINGHTVTFTQSNSAYTASAGNIVTNNFGIYTIVTSTAAVTEASTTLTVERPGALRLTAGQRFYIVDNTSTARLLTFVSLSGTTITFSQSNSAYTASVGNLVRSFGEQMAVTTTSAITETSTVITLAATKLLDLTIGKVIHIRDNTGTYRPLTVSSLTATTIGVTQSNSAYTASIGNALRVVTGGCTGRHSVVVQNATNVKMIGNELSGSAESGIRVVNTRGLTITTNTVRQCANNGIALSGTNLDGSDLTDVIIGDNDVRRCAIDSTVTAWGISVTNAQRVTSRENNVSRNVGGGIFYQNVKTGTLALNMMDDGDTRTMNTGIQAIYGCTDLTLATNTVLNVARHGIEVNATLPGTYTLSNAKLLGNIVRNVGLKGILAQNVTGLVIDEMNTVSFAAADHGIAVADCTDVDVHRNKVSFCGANGISVTSPGALTDEARVSNNVARNNSQLGSALYHGIFLNDMVTAYAVNNRCFDDQGTKLQNYGVVISTGVTNGYILYNLLKASRQAAGFLNSSTTPTNTGNIV